MEGTPQSGEEAVYAGFALEQASRSAIPGYTTQLSYPQKTAESQKIRGNQ